MTKAQLAAALQIQNTRQRLLVRAADAALAPMSWFRARRRPDRVRRVLLMRLERIGDLLMVIGAIRDARASWPDAEIDLAVGAWNVPLANLIAEVTRVRVLSVPWLSRHTDGDSWPTLISTARQWRSPGYDVVVNFEPDIRSNALAWLTGAPLRIGYSSGGGGPLLTDAGAYDNSSHVAVNADELIHRAAGSAYRHAPEPATGATRVTLPAESLAQADAMIAGLKRPLIGVHASGGRLSKQWHLDRFGTVARTLALGHDGTIVLTGAQSDRGLVEDVKAQLAGVPVIDAVGNLDLPALGALLSRLDLLITGDTGPMHLGAAVGVPMVALFGPSDPRRYGPVGTRYRVLRVDLPCSPCGQVRLPPEPCRGHVPDCMDGIRVDAVVAAAEELLGAAGRRGGC